MDLLDFDRETPCPACGIRVQIDRVCRDEHDDLNAGGERDRPPAHLHVACPGCGWSGYMRTASPDSPLPRRV